jgi:hypothetical protein
MADEPAEIPTVTVVSAPESPVPLPLPDAVKAGLLRLAQHSDVLIIGELHGTSEIPRLIAALYSDLLALGYRALAFELPSDMREEVAGWGIDPTCAIPRFYARPSEDGRGNAEVLGLIRDTSTGWTLLCFDQATSDTFTNWAGRDARMAANLAAQRRQFCPGGKVLAVCGNMHSRLRRTYEPGHPSYEYWPSFAANLADGNPWLSVGSINVHYHGGATYNGGRVIELYEGDPLPKAYLEEDSSGEHTALLHLPHATVPPFLAPPATR